MKNMIYDDYAFFIIGNGFDLACGYKTSFQNYLEHVVHNCKDEYSLDLVTFLHYIYKKYDSNNHIFDFIFNDNNWSDIEKNILDMENKGLINIVQDKIRRLNEDFYLRNIIKNGQVDEIVLSDYAYGQDFSERDIKLLLYVIRKYENNFSNKDFLNEINSFEKSLKDYLNMTLLEKNGEKIEKAKYIFDKISEKFRSGIVFNFNYTDTLDDICTNKFEVRHVHGKLDTQIIVGVDLTEVGKGTNNISKTYRILDLKKETNFDTMPSKPKEIVFYGHSLNKQDYSYFQSIFDHVNLYSSDVRLTFYYSDYEKNGEEFYKQKGRVIKLIEIYGKTLDNKDHGRNLLHKLLIEERIVFKEMKLK